MIHLFCGSYDTTSRFKKQPLFDGRQDISSFENNLLIFDKKRLTFDMDCGTVTAIKEKAEECNMLEHRTEWLRGIVVGAAVCGVMVCFVIVPWLGRDIAEAHPELAGRFWPWMLLIWVCSLPCFGALIPGWRLFGRMGRSSAFCRENAACLRWVARLIGWDSVFFLAMYFVYYLLDISHPGVLLLALLLSFCGAAVAVAARVLSGLVTDAAVLREDNDLTI